MDKIILTGAAGFVGASIISKLKNKFKIVAIDDFSYGYKERLNDFNKDIQLVEGDVKDIKKLLEGSDYKALINCAAVAPLPENQANMYNSLTQNTATCGSLIDFVTERGIKKIIHFSSGAVYEGNTASKKGLPSSEKDKISPRLAYPVSKMLSEVYFKSQAGLFNLDITCIRLFNLYGPRQDYFRKHPPLLGYLIKAALEGNPITLFAKEKIKRDYIYIDDLVSFIREDLTKSDLSGFNVFNIGSGQSYSVYEIVRLVEDEVGTKINFTKGATEGFWGKYPNLFSGKIPLPYNVVEEEINKSAICNLEKVFGKFNWRPTATMSEGIRDCVRYAREIL